MAASTAPDSITPGRSFPGKTMGRSKAPVAMIIFLARTCQILPPSTFVADFSKTVRKPWSYRPKPVARSRAIPFSSSLPHVLAAQFSAVSPSIVQPGRECTRPPGSESLSKMATFFPELRAHRAAASPAKPAPITATST